MTIYYTRDTEGNITESSVYGCETHWLNCFQTEEEIIQYEYNRYLKSELEVIQQTDKYKTQERLKEIEKELDLANTVFAIASQTPIEFEGKSYKFEWTSLYQSLLGLSDSLFPIKIWDMSNLAENAMFFTKEKLQMLQDILIAVQEPAFQNRKEIQAELIKEKTELMEA